MNYTIIRAIDSFFNVMVWLIIIRSLASILIRDYSNPIVKSLYEVTEPILEPFRRLIYSLKIDTGMMDFSPLLAIIVINILRRLIIGILV